MWRNRAREAAVLLALTAAAGTARGQTSGSLRAGIAITPTQEAALAVGDQNLQLEVYVNGQTTNLVAGFTLHKDGSIGSTVEELDAVGIKVPVEAVAKNGEVPLRDLPGVTYHYEDSAQVIRFAVGVLSQKPTRISGRGIMAAPARPVRPPLGALVNYTLFGSADDAQGGPRFQGVSGAFDTRLFGSFGLIENSLVARLGGTGPRTMRLNSSYVYEIPDRLLTIQAGDLISGGFSWTRPIRMGGLQIRRSFGQRPDLITLPLPTFTGSAAAPSTLDLYVNQVRTLSTTIPQGPYQIDHPPIVYGGGEAQIVLRDALGREVVSTSAFYASPDLLAAGLTDFSAEMGFARRNYASVSNDYDRHLAVSGSYRRGITSTLTMQGHFETVDGMAAAGGGAAVTIGKIGLASIAVSGSRGGGASGALIDAAFETRTPLLSLILRTQRTYGTYQDIATWTAVVPPNLAGDRRLFGQPRELDQVAISVPLPATHTALGASYVRARNADDSRSRIVNLSLTQDIGPLALFASGVRDFDASGTTSLFLGLSVPLGKRISATAGGTQRRGADRGFVEVARQGAQVPGSFGWSLRAALGDDPQARAILRYSSDFANFEVTALHSQTGTVATGLMEGAIAFVGGGVHVSHRLSDAFALVDVGAPGVTILRENRVVGVTGASGKLLVPDLAPFVTNRIALDPAGLPVDANVERTEATVTPFSRVEGRVDLRVVTDTRSALVMLVDAQQKPIEIGSTVRLGQQDRSFVVGYDGAAFVQDAIAGDNPMQVTMPDGTVCRTSFHYRAAPGEQVRIGPVTCAAAAR